MPRRLPVLTCAAATALTAALLAVPSPALAAGGPAKGPTKGNAAGKAVALTPLSSTERRGYDESAAEIVAHDPLTQRLFVVNAQAGAVDVLDARDPARPVLLGTLDARGLPVRDGGTTGDEAVVNSVDVRDGVLAVAVEADDKTSPGAAAFFRTSDLAPLSAVRVGAQPDMLTFTPDGRSVLVANEGEPDDDFAADPEGTVSVVDVSGGAAGLTQAAVRTARFTAFEGAALPAGVRVFGPDVPVPAGQPAAGRVARNLEPEYVAVDADSRTAYVSLQEANTIAVVDVASATVTRLLPLGTKDWSDPAVSGGLDAVSSDRRAVVRNERLRSYYQPDAIATYRFRGQTYLVTANEGDSRNDWGDYEEVGRLDRAPFPVCPELADDARRWGALNVVLEEGLVTRDGVRCYAEVVLGGARSMSVFTTDGRLVSDTGSQLEELVRDTPGVVFGASNTNTTLDNRSDDKGPEPEGVDVGQVQGRTYAFLGLERVGGVVALDVTDPRAVSLVAYRNTRDFAFAPSDPRSGDSGAEGVTFVPGEDRADGRPLLAVAHEVSGTTSLLAVEPRKR